MSLKKTYRSHKKLNAGPGGWGCPCCNPYRCHPRRMKSKARRFVRRVEKARLTKEWE
jgi:hypothetical protein